MLTRGDPWIAKGLERQLRDVAGILAARGGELDQAYLDRWIDELALRDLWQRAQVETVI